MIGYNMIRKITLMCMAVVFSTTMFGCWGTIGGSNKTTYLSGGKSMEGATVTLPRGRGGTIPVEVRFSSKEETNLVIIEKEGFKTKKVYIDREINGWTWLNFFLPPFVLGFAVDFITGSIFEYPGDAYLGNLERN